MSFADKVTDYQEKIKKKRAPISEPVWQLPRDGISFSMLSKWIVCRERFRLYAVEGLAESKGFDKALEFGNLMHEALDVFGKTGDEKTALEAMSEYTSELVGWYGHYDIDEIVKWSTIAKGVFQNYADSYMDEDKNKFPLLYEKVFESTVTLPSGRTVKLMGKFDGSFMEEMTKEDIEKYGSHYSEKWSYFKGAKSNKTIHQEFFLKEIKCKGEIDIDAFLGGLTMECQTMLYLTAMLWSDFTLNPEWEEGEENTYPGFFGQQPVLGELPEVRSNRPPGILYDTIRRPLAFMTKYSIRQKKKQTPEEFYEEVIGTVENDPAYFFNRFKFRPSWEDLIRFQNRTLIPILEQLVDWWESIEANPFNPWTTSSGEVNSHHYQRPFGIYDGMAKGFHGDFFNYLTTGSVVGLERIETTFPELENVG